MTERLKVLLAATVMVLSAGDLPASVVYGFNNVRYFPPGDGTVFDTASGTLTPSTVDSHTTSFSTGGPGANLFDGIDSITGSPFQMEVKNSVTINTATTSSFSNWLSFAVADVNETGVVVTGGSGTGYLLPTFRIQGSFNNGSSNLISSVDTCDGNGSCVVASPAFNISGTQGVDVTYTPGIDATTSFQFGTPFNIDWEVDAFVGYNGPQADPGGPLVADFTMVLESVRVVNADGRTLPATIHSELMGAPEPGGLALCVAGFVGWVFKWKISPSRG